MASYPARLEPGIEAWRAANPDAGVAVAVVADGATVYAQGFGARNGVPVAPTTPFEAGSLTKPVFACGVMQLVEEGALDLDAPLAGYLPRPYLPDEPSLARITARHALSHTTGFPNWRDGDGLRAAFPPGSRFSYSGEGYLFLQTVVEQVTGLPLPDFVAARVLAPLAMDDSEMMIEDWRDYRPFVPPGRRAYAAASLRTTAADYARFLQAMLKPNAVAGRWLSQASVDAMLTAQIPVGEQAGLAWGLGWGVQTDAQGKTTLWHWGGWRDATRNFILGDRTRGTGIVILTSSLAGLPLCEQLAEAALGHHGGYPAFRWLLPVDQWRPDGRLPTPA